MTSEAWGVIGAALLTVLGSVFVAIRSAHLVSVAAHQSALVEDRRVDLQEWQAILETLRTETESLRGRIATAEHRVSELEAHADAQRVALHRHSVWDNLAIQELRQSGVTHLLDPPPLHPPTRSA